MPRTYNTRITAMERRHLGLSQPFASRHDRRVDEPRAEGVVGLLDLSAPDEIALVELMQAVPTARDVAYERNLAGDA